MLARAIRDHALHLHGALTPRVRRGIVKQLSPLSVELIDADVLIDADEMLLGAWLRLYDEQFGIEVGDTAFLYPLESGDWLAFDVASNLDYDFDIHLVGATGEPAFQNSWVNYGLGQRACRFWKGIDGIVHLEGLVKSGSVPGVIFTLPEGYRPDEVVVLSSLSFTGAAYQVAAVQAAINGDVSVQVGGTNWVVLSNLSFLP